MAKKTKSGLYCIQFYVNETEYNEYARRYEKFKKLRINRSAGKSEISESAFCRRIILDVDPLHRGAPIGNKNRVGKKGKNGETLTSSLLKTDRTSQDSS